MGREDTFRPRRVNRRLFQMTANKLVKEVCATVAAISVTVLTVSAVPLPQPEFVDAGASTNVALSALSASGELSFSLSFVPGASNNVEVAFGADLDSDGVLSPDERRMEAGWDCGDGGNCGCNGCSIDGVYSIEDATFSLPSLWCGCRASEYGGTTNEPPSTPSVSVSFDKTVVFYEDAYTNAPNDVVAKHSTNTTLTVSAYGGEDGGMLYVSAQKMDKLVRTGGNAIAFPYTAFVPPHGGVSFSIEYEAETHSDSEGDIIVTASLLPGSGGGTLGDSASTTAVKVLLEAQVPVTFTPNCSRHRYGVREIVLCKYFPENMSLSWQCTGGGRIVPGQGGDFTRFICPITNSGCSISVMGADGLSYSPVISVIEPEGFFCRTITEMNFELGENVAGGAGMALELYITPTNVCFGNIALEEVPTTTGEVGGYFENEEFSAMWAHTRERRAGQWNDIGNDNLFLMEDEAVMGDVLPPMAPDGTLTNEVSFGWRDGAIIWTIPLGWNERGTSGETEPIKTNAVPEHQTFIITPDGTLSVIKAGHYVSRGTNTQIRSGRVQR